jgi:4a-hydroxytetrahydrobiopterin dehydratase
MSTSTLEQLVSKRCAACEGNLKKLTPRQARQQVKALNGWRLTHGGKCIRKDWQVKHFGEAVSFLNRVAQVAETEGHHPDFHLENYRRVRIEIWTHSLSGLTENDFVLAAKIDRLPIALKNLAPSSGV